MKMHKFFLLFIVLVLCLFIKFGSCDYDISDKIIFPNLPNAAPRSSNNVCREQSQAYIKNLGNMTLWAHKMWDATAKSTSGVLHGTLFHFGNFWECLNIDGPYKTQYCLATVTAAVPDEYKPGDTYQIAFNPHGNVLTKIYLTKDGSKQSRNVAHLGWCVPASCTILDLEKSLKDYLEKLEHPFHNYNVSYSAQVMPHTCQNEDELIIIDSADISFCILAVILIILVVIGTIYEIQTNDDLPEKNKSKVSLFHKILVAFSARKSYHDLQRPDENNESLRVLYGLKIFAICMVIMDHRFGTFISGPLSNFDYIESEYRSRSSWFLFHGDLFVDTFFILSGILVAYGLLSQFEKKFIHPGLIILFRYVRLTPLYAFVIFFWATMLEHIGSGPFWKFVVPPEVEDCKNNWWLNILYLSNYFNDNHMCMIHSWYLPCDFHYFIIAIFIVLLIGKNKKTGFAVLTGILLLSIIIPFLITVVFMRPGLMHFYPKVLAQPKASPDWHFTYTKSHTRASTYFMGMYAGYVFYKLKDKEVKMSKLKSHALTFISLILLFGGMASGAIFYDPYHKYNAFEAGAYAALHRPLWALGTLGIIFSSSYGHATALYKVLSWRPWIPLGKLVYGAYLTHMLFQLRAVGVTSTATDFKYFDTVCKAFGDMLLAFLLSLALFLMIENPFRKIIKYLLMPQDKTKHNDVTLERSDGKDAQSTTTCNSRL